MNIAEVRQAFLDFFSNKGHQSVASGSLIPANDPSLMFVNAGMVQFKDVFLGRESKPFTRAVSSQRCVRAGGKHNDLENVGYTARHHTFFEMLGNFSFGDYFKLQAIEYAWEFLTVILKIPAEKLWVTVFNEDTETADIWLNHIGIDAKRFSKIGAKDNFWSMANTGPCGPCTEIFYDHGETIAGGPPGSENEEGERYVEIWNLVFMQYNRDAEGNLNPLPKPSVDTGMGLERLAAVMQGVHSNYDIDLFQTLIQAIAKLAHMDDLSNNSLRVIADHIRSCAFLIVDNVTPSNVGRDYVLRRIIRRALLHGNKLGLTQPFFHQLVAPLVSLMGEAYPELIREKEKIEQVLLQEETRFLERLDSGVKILMKHIESLSTDTISGELMFKLYSTYGFPTDLTRDIGIENHLKLDYDGFHKIMALEKEKTKSKGRFSDFNEHIDIEQATEFSGYDHHAGTADIIALLVDGQQVESIHSGQAAQMILSRTPFYAESGGQRGDQGFIHSTSGKFIVEKTKKQNQTFVHYGRCEMGEITYAQTVTTQINTERRAMITANHSATHLLHAALRQVLGNHVSQKGSDVGADRLRFDFSHFQPVSQAELVLIARLVNQHIRNNHRVETQNLALQAALKSGAMALFDEKYSDKVRVLSISAFSVELCGGTHVERTGSIGLFKIITETGCASGVRRIEAVTGEVAINVLTTLEQQNQNIAQMLKCDKHHTLTKVEQVLTQLRKLEKQIDGYQAKLASQAGDARLDQIKRIDGIQLLAFREDKIEVKHSKNYVDQLKDKMQSGIVVIIVAKGLKVQIIVGVSNDLAKIYDAVKLARYLSAICGGKGGGGRAEMAQAGGVAPEKIAIALDSIAQWMTEQKIGKS